MQSVAIAQIHLQHFLSSQITQCIVKCFENITITPAFILTLIFLNKTN